MRFLFWVLILGTVSNSLQMWLGFVNKLLLEILNAALWRTTNAAVIHDGDVPVTFLGFNLSGLFQAVIWLSPCVDVEFRDYPSFGRLPSWEFSVVRRVCEIAKRDYYLRQVCLSVRSSAWSNSDPTLRTFMKFDIEYFSKICRENSRLIKIWQE
jgi:hypothetical protein